ncbi:hypothetical protein JVT61DRAFT_9879 [Boletus reticuloceps]|uniref:Uncharacterized protein n=1 Tax=Boletus reticuloceps TaxID=495285 RepID=A0A8I3A632_9AGAM|nr:hypothetical protein JVT61DRAFT_9879 [Boletus reticuloceps]
MFISGITPDSMGDGVTREVLDAALRIVCSCVSPLDTQTDEGFVMMNLLRSFCAPLPLSPALLQAVIGGVESLDDPSWLQAVLPESWSTLRLFPVSRLAVHDESSLSATDHNRLRTLLYLIDKQSLSELSSVRDVQWPSLLRRIQSSYLLGVRPREITESLTYAAFRDGIDQALSPMHPSFIELISSSSKYLLHDLYTTCRLISPGTLIERLFYSLDGDETWKNQSNELLASLKAHLERYLKGVGHPAGGVFEALVGVDQFQRDNNDVNYRTQQFIKMTSGVNVFCQAGEHFLVYLRQDIPPSVGLGRHYNILQDPLPPAFHACTLEVEFWVNEGLKKLLSGAPPQDMTTPTAFDMFFHSSIVDIGEDDFNA